MVEEKHIELNARPNPFSTKLSIDFSLQKTGITTLSVYSTSGVLVKELYKGTAEANQLHKLELDGTTLKQGMYIVRMITDNQVAQCKVILIK